MHNKHHFIAVSWILTTLIVVGDYQNGILSLTVLVFDKNIKYLWVTKQSAIKKERDF